MIRISTYSVKLVKENCKHYNLTSKTIKEPSDAYNAVSEILGIQSESVEKFGIIALNAKNVIIGIHVLSVGTIDAAMVQPREVFKAALLNNATSVILFHNHPSGDPSPSNEDILLTKNLEFIGEIMGIEV